MSITTKDIAKLAGVSRGTVDRALNNRGQIAEAVKDNILRIAKEHGYVKNVFASSLAKREKTLVLVVLPDPTLDTFWAAPIEGINNTLLNYAALGLEIKFQYFNHKEEKSFCQSMEKAISQKPQAILMAPLFLKESLLYFQIASQNNIPVVCINSEISNDNILCYIGQDSFQCGVISGKLFNLKPLTKKTIAAITLGHHANNAIHIDKKINGLRYYNRFNNSDFNIVELVCNDFEDTMELEKLSKQLISMRSELHGIFFTNSRAFKLLNMNQLLNVNLSEVVIIGFDLIEQNVALLEDGTIDFLLNQNPKRQGELGLSSIFNFLIHNIDIPKKTYLPIDIVIKENYQQHLQ